MHIHLTENQGAPIYPQIVQQVKYMVAAGRLKSGDQLPAVRRLAEQLLINPNTVARAYRELESEGVVRSRRGAGVFVTEGGSPLGQDQRLRILTERIDALLAESRQMNVDLKTLLDQIEQRHQAMNTASPGALSVPEDPMS